MPGMGRVPWVAMTAPPPSLTNVEQFPGDIVIVDISGYTRFVKMHRTAMVHASRSSPISWRAFWTCKVRPWCSTS